LGYRSLEKSTITFVWCGVSLERFRAALHGSASHVMVGFIVSDVGHEQDHGRVTEILPPVGRAVDLATKVSGLMNDRHRAVAGVFDDLALGDVNQSRTVFMAVPRHHAARLDRQFAKPELTILDHGRLFAQIDRTKRCIDEADSRRGDRLASSGFHLVSRAFARERTTGDTRSNGKQTAQKYGAADSAGWSKDRHGDVLLSWPSLGKSGLGYGRNIVEPVEH